MVCFCGCILWRLWRRCGCLSSKLRIICRDKEFNLQTRNSHLLSLLSLNWFEIRVTLAKLKKEIGCRMCFWRNPRNSFLGIEVAGLFKLLRVRWPFTAGIREWQLTSNFIFYDLSSPRFHFSSASLGNKKKKNHQFYGIATSCCNLFLLLEFLLRFV